MFIRRVALFAKQQFVGGILLSAHTRRKYAALAENIIDPISTNDSYTNLRVKQLEKLHGSSLDAAYPSDFSERSMKISNFSKTYNHVYKSGERNEELSETLMGRVLAKRVASTKLFFLDIVRDGHQVQIANSLVNFTSSFDTYVSQIHIGDVVEATGFPGKTRKGELSLFARDIKLLAPCLHRLPTKTGLDDPVLRSKKRYLDMIINPEIIQRMKARSKIISYLRCFLNDRDFLEVETPILSSSIGGAIARPFSTFSNSLNMDLQMRISPELYLKQLLVGGVDRVYEIGKQFRNEGIDATHNPEFTTCEFYQTYANYKDLMKMTETLLAQLVEHTVGSTKVKINDANGKTTDIEFGGEYRKIDIVDYIKEKHGLNLDDYVHEQDIKPLLVQMKEKGIALPVLPFTLPRLLDHIISYYLEPECIQPTFICQHPIALSPLAKRNDQRSNRSARFELLVSGKELINAYTELNIPMEQRKRFALQQNDRDRGDDEMPGVNESFCEALEYGLPPCAGWGLGIDRLCMLLSGTPHIRDVLTFSVTKSHA